MARRKTFLPYTAYGLLVLLVLALTGSLAHDEYCYSALPYTERGAQHGGPLATILRCEDNGKPGKYDARYEPDEKVTDGEYRLKVAAVISGYRANQIADAQRRITGLSALAVVISMAIAVLTLVRLAANDEPPKVTRRRTFWVRRDKMRERRLVRGISRMRRQGRR